MRHWWVALMLGVFGCDDSGAEGAGGGAGGEPAMDMGPPAYGRAEDLAIAADVWTEIADRAEWAQPIEGFTENDGAHGGAQRLLHNGAEMTAPGYVIVKENYESAEGDLLAITAMKRQPGFGPQTGGWFFVRFSPAGEVGTDEAGLRQAGMVGVGTGIGCVPCHEGAPGGDYLFNFDPE